MSVTNQAVLGGVNGLEIALELLSFSGGLNTISEDQAMKPSEARALENWVATSLGGMERAKGFNEVADGGGSYTDKLDLLIQHKDSGGTQIYGICEGDLIYKNGSGFTNDDNGAFTSGLLSHGVSAGAALWITNTTDNLKRKTVGVAVAVPASVPTTACARIYNHKNRLVAEGSTSQTKRIYGSRTGTGNWTAADAWSLSNDAWSIDLPEDTRGCVPNFPSGNEILVFTERGTYALSNFPNTAFRPVSTPGRGCSAPYSIALGDEGVYFLSRYPTLGVYLFDGTNFTQLTEFNRDVFVEKIDFTHRIFGIYRNRTYKIFYSDTDNGVSYPDTCMEYDARFGRWMKRDVNSALADNFGYPALLQYSNNELYAASSRKDKIYELETDDDSDEGQSTEAVFTTKTFSSRDFAIASGGQFPIDDVRMKLLKVIVTYYGTTGSLGFYWSADRGLHSGSKTIDLTADGDLLNTSFIVNTSYIATVPPDKTRTYVFPNDAVGRRFQFIISNSGSSTRPKVKKIKVVALALNEA